MQLRRTRAGQWRGIIYSIAVGITLMLAVSTTVITLPFTQRLLLATAPVSEISVDERWHATRTLLTYFGTENSALIAGYTPEEQAHLAEVAIIFRTLGLLLLVSAITALTTGIGIAKRDGRAVLKNQTRQALGATAIFCLGTVLTGLLAFPLLFAIFHRLSFVSAPWAFDPASSRLVNLYPEEYFRNAAAAILLVSAAMSGGTRWLIRK